MSIFSGIFHSRDKPKNSTAGLGFDELAGYSPITMAKNAVGLAIATEEYGAKFFANEATPSGQLEYPGTVKDPERVRDS